MKRLMLALVGLAALAGCSLHHTIDNGLFHDLTVDKKMRLFDAENDVSISVDEREQMRERVRVIKAELRYAARQVDQAADKSLAVTEHVWELRQTYLDGSLDYLRERIAAQDGVVLSARAKFELAKALLVKKNKLPGAEDLDVKDFEAQVTELGDASRAELAELDLEKPALQQARTDWLKARDELAASSLSSLGTPGADEIPVWESW